MFYIYAYLLSAVARLAFGTTLLWLALYVPAYDSIYVDLIGITVMCCSLDVVICNRPINKMAALTISLLPETIVNLILFKNQGVMSVVLVEILLAIIFGFTLMRVPQTNCVVKWIQEKHNAGQ